MAETSYRLEPKEFDNIYTKRGSVDGVNPFASWKNKLFVPPRPKWDVNSDVSHSGVWIAMPNNIKVNTIELTSLDWEAVKIPLCLRYLLWGKQLLYRYKHDVYLKDSKTGEVLSFLADMDRYDGEFPEPLVLYPESVGGGQAHTYNITFFTKLPNYSATYEVWVRIGDVESNHTKLIVDVYENGKRIERPKE